MDCIAPEISVTRYNLGNYQEFIMCTASGQISPQHKHVVHGFSIVSKHANTMGRIVFPVELGRTKHDS